MDANPTNYLHSTLNKVRQKMLHSPIILYYMSKLKTFFSPFSAAPLISAGIMKAAWASSMIHVLVLCKYDDKYLSDESL